MQTQTKITLANFASEVISTMGLENLEATRRKKLRLQLQEMLVNHILNVLLSTLDEDGKNALASQLEAADNMEDFFTIIFDEIPSAKEIIQEETEILFARLIK